MNENLINISVTDTWLWMDGWMNEILINVSVADTWSWMNELMKFDKHISCWYLVMDE